MNDQHYNQPTLKGKLEGSQSYEICMECGHAIDLDKLKNHVEKGCYQPTTQKQFLKNGNYLIEIVKEKAEKGSPYFFNPQTMRAFSSRISELCWQVDDDIFFITSEADRHSSFQHSGTSRGYTVRKCDLNGDIQTHSKFQEFNNLKEARDYIKKIWESDPND